MPTVPTVTHLGIPLKQETFPSTHHVGMRYWQIVPGVNKRQALGAPCGIGLGVNWAPGLNKGACQTTHKNHQDWTHCSCGLYCFKHGPNVGKTSYFDFPTATPNSGANAGVVGGIAYWIPRTQNPVPGQTIVSAKYAAVACLMYPKDANKEHKKTIDALADFYQVDIVVPADMKDAVDEWVANRLPSFYDAPARPLHELIGKQAPYQVAGDWTYTPRQRQPLVFAV